jgi:serine/threonine protein kinase
MILKGEWMEFKGRRFLFHAGERIGAGGMGEVLFGRTSDGSQEVAIKRPLAALAPENRDLFLREAEAAARAAGPGVVRVVDWGDAPPFIAYELVRDPTLDREIIRRRAANEPWPVSELVSAYSQLVAALKTVNQHVLHRDLKPPNIFIGAGQVRVADFGLAKYVDEATRTRTFKGWGTAPYLSPEAWQGLSLDWRSDQYSLGVVFFEMATLQRPFAGPDDVQEQKHLYERPPRVDAVVQGFPTPLASTMARMLEKRREDRFSSWDELHSQLTVAAKASAQGPSLPDPIARMLVEQVDAHRRQELERSRVEEERTQLESERRNLVGYWWKAFSEKMIERFNGLNEQAGHKAISYTERRDRLEASLLNGRFEFFLEPVPVEDAEVVAWGLLKVTTPKPAAVSNIFLRREPRPYGMWMEASMEVSPLIPGPIDASQLSRGRGGRYEIIGRVVVAQNWYALAEQRAIRNVMSLVQYSEAQLQFERSVEECLQIFVRDGSASAPSRQL